MKRLFVILAVLLFTLTMSASVSGKVINASNESTCNPLFGTALAGSVGLWGEDNFHGYGGNLGGNGLFFCQSNRGVSGVTDLFNIHEDADENCRGFLTYDSGRFADCINSIKVKGKAGWDFCIYTDPNYLGQGLVFLGDGEISALSSTYKDKFSSMRWVTDGGC